MRPLVHSSIQSGNVSNSVVEIILVLKRKNPKVILKNFHNTGDVNYVLKRSRRCGLIEVDSSKGFKIGNIIVVSIGIQIEVRNLKIFLAVISA